MFQQKQWNKENRRSEIPLSGAKEELRPWILRQIRDVTHEFSQQLWLLLPVMPVSMQGSNTGPINCGMPANCGFQCACFWTKKASSCSRHCAFYTKSARYCAFSSQNRHTIEFNDSLPPCKLASASGGDNSSTASQKCDRVSSTIHLLSGSGGRQREGGRQVRGRGGARVISLLYAHVPKVPETADVQSTWVRPEARCHRQHGNGRMTLEVCNASISSTLSCV